MVVVVAFFGPQLPFFFQLKFWTYWMVNKITNETYICLIPKKLNPCKINYCRPINLCKVILSLRLMDLLGEPIYQAQGLVIAK